MMNGGAVSWQSTRQHVTALSTAEAEYYAASVAGVEITYMRRILEEMGYSQREPTVTYEDNMACIYMSRTSVMYHKARHIDTRVYRLREMCRDGIMIMEKVQTNDQAADALTKALARPAFERHRDTMMGMRSTGAPITDTDQWMDDVGNLDPAVRDQVHDEIGPMMPAGVVQQLTAGRSVSGERRSRDERECAMIATSGRQKGKRARLAEMVRAEAQQVQCTALEVQCEFGTGRTVRIRKCARGTGAYDG
jgi:hypothetical protein